jgi:ATPase subunit of ABC transporter with duplicated ATPase domains
LFTFKKEIVLILQNISYTHSDKEVLFSDINVISKPGKIALIGNNGAGKSTLLKIMAGLCAPSAGTVNANSAPYYIPQLFGQFNNITMAQALNIEQKLKALHSILGGDVTDLNLALLNDDWTIEERCREALHYWGLSDMQLTQRMETLSGGQKTKVFLAGIFIHQPEIILLDEPSNHLDTRGRKLLYDFIQSCSATLIVVSHDRKLLNLLHTVYELSKRGITVYGGNYDFYVQQKAIENNALNEDIRSREKALRKAKEIERETMERQQKLDARGKKKQEKAGLPTISMNTLRNNAEKSTARLKDIHAAKTGDISQELNELRYALPDMDKMKLGFYNSTLHKGKILITATGINYSYEQLLWKQALDFQITSGERIALKGLNGSGKTTLIKIALGNLQPSVGTITRVAKKCGYCCAASR